MGKAGAEASTSSGIQRIKARCPQSCCEDNGLTQNGVSHGEGKCTKLKVHDNSNFAKNYEGAFDHGLRSGFGTLKWMDYILRPLQGPISASKPTIERSLLKTVYQAQWKDNEMNGLGDLKNANGHKFVGHFEGGRCSGPGYLVYPDGKWMAAYVKHLHWKGASIFMNN